MLVLNNIHKSFSTKRLFHKAHSTNNDILKNINLTFERGSISLINGENGSGKTTLLRIIAGIILPDKGLVLLDDKKLNHKVVSFCSNNSRGFFWRLTAYENLRYFCALNNTNDNLANIDELAIKFNIFNKLNRPLQELSLGEIQKINLIRGICIDTEIYIFDEADASLDRDSKKCFFDEIENLKRKNKIIIHVTHEMNYPYHIKNKIINSNDFKD